MSVLSVTVPELLALADEVNRQHVRSVEAFWHRGAEQGTPAWDHWREEAARFHDRQQDLAARIPPARTVRGGDPAGVEAAVTFIEADPWFFRSGYIKGRLMESLSRAGGVILAPYRERLASALLALPSRRGRPEFVTARKLAPFADNAHFRDGLRSLIRHGRYAEQSRSLYLYTQLPGLHLRTDECVSVDLLVRIASARLGPTTLRWLGWVARELDTPTVQADLLTRLRSGHPVHLGAVRVLAALPGPTLTEEDRSRLERHVLTVGRRLVVPAATLLRKVGGASPAALEELASRTREVDPDAGWVRAALMR
jgi:hypothetical protein